MDSANCPYWWFKVNGMELKTQSIVIMRGEVDPQTARMTGMKTLFVGVCSNTYKHLQICFQALWPFFEGGLLFNAFWIWHIDWRSCITWKGKTCSHSVCAQMHFSTHLSRLLTQVGIYQNHKLRSKTRNLCYYTWVHFTYFSVSRHFYVFLNFTECFEMLSVK